MGQIFSTKFSKLIITLTLVLVPDAFTKELSSRFFYMNLNMAALYGLDHASPNTNNNSTNVILSDVEASIPTGGGLSGGFEILASLPVSFFVGFDFNYIKDASNSSVRRGVEVVGATLTLFKQKLRIYESVLESGLNVNLKLTDSIIQFFASAGIGTSHRFERLAYSTLDGDTRDFLRESRADSTLVRLSAGARYINTQRLFCSFKLSLTDLTLADQENDYIISTASSTSISTDFQELNDTADENQYFSVYLGAGYYF